jgi:2-keto-4-pentenoate hydratase
MVTNGGTAGASRDGQVTAAARRLREAESNRQTCPPIRILFPELTDEVSAYQVQAENTRHALANGRRLVGRKIGLTAKSVQQQLGVDTPDYGMLFADMIRADGEEIACGDVLQPKLEAEIALVLERDLAVEQPTIADIIRATAYVLPALEIVDSRIANWDIRLVDTVADNASSGLFVLGGTPHRLEGLDLRGCRMELSGRSSADGAAEILSTGEGAACLGHPLNAAVWLARKMVAVESPLRAGDIVMTGALGPMVPLVAGHRYEAVIDGVGSVRTALGNR